MLINYKNLENIDDFQFLQKKQNQWYLCKEDKEDWEKYAFVEDVNSFLVQHTQFAKINESTVINLNYFLDLSEYNLKNLLLKNNVYKKYLASVKLAYKILINKKTESEISNENSKITEKRKIKFENIEIDKIKFIVRIGSITEIYFNDNSISYVYETVKVFEKKLLQSSMFIRIGRGCIINFEYISFFKEDNKKRFAELKIGTHHFKISRRLLNSFKIKAINIT